MPLHHNALQAAMPAYCSPSELASLLGLSRASVYNLLRAGVLTGKKLGARTVCPTGPALAYMASLPDVQFRGSKTRIAGAEP